MRDRRLRLNHRMKRRLINLLTALSLLLCAMSVAAWCVSHFHCGELRVGTGRTYGVFFVVGALNVGHLRVGTVRERLADDDPDPRRHQPLTRFFMSYGPESAGRGRTGWAAWLGCERIALRGSGASLSRTGRRAVLEFDTVGVPLWAVAGLAAVLPAARLRRRRIARRRHRRGACLHCGYDLRATPDKCPECGLVT
jgi:hypothetical protein